MHLVVRIAGSGGGSGDRMEPLCHRGQPGGWPTHRCHGARGRTWSWKRPGNAAAMIPGPRSSADGMDPGHGGSVAAWKGRTIPRWARRVPARIPFPFPFPLHVAARLLYGLRPFASRGGSPSRRGTLGRKPDRRAGGNRVADLLRRLRARDPRRFRSTILLLLLAGCPLIPTRVDLLYRAHRAARP